MWRKVGQFIGVGVVIALAIFVALITDAVFRPGIG